MSNKLYSDDRTPRMRPAVNCKGKVFWHPCSVCGYIHASFGFDVDIDRGKSGTWYCADHKDQHERGENVLL